MSRSVLKKNLAIESIKWIANLLKAGYRITSIDEMDIGVYKLHLEVLPRYAHLKDTHRLYIDKETGYTVSLVGGDIVTFGRFEIYDKNTLIDGIERYDSLSEAERRIVELVKRIRSMGGEHDD